MSKTCEVCLLTKKINQFYLYMQKCRSCCTEYYRQYRIYNKEKKFYLCDICDKNFCNKIALNNHKQTELHKKKEMLKNCLENKKIVEFKYEKCEFKTINEIVFNNHINKHNKIKKIYSCEVL